jgi:hypothetical protein
MPWKECSVMDERLKFVARRLAGEPLAELCREFGISRKTDLSGLCRVRESIPRRTKYCQFCQWTGTRRTSRLRSDFALERSEGFRRPSLTQEASKRYCIVSTGATLQ